MAEQRLENDAGWVAWNNKVEIVDDECASVYSLCVALEEIMRLRERVEALEGRVPAQ